MIDALNTTLERQAAQVEELRDALKAEKELSKSLHLALAQKTVQQHSWFENKAWFE